MTSKEILGADLLDILFDNRNKSYGAYELRRHYNERLMKALALSFSLVLLLLFLFNGEGKKSLTNFEPKPEVVIREHVVPQTIIPPVTPPVRTIPPAASQVSYNRISFVDMPDPDKEMAPVTGINRSIIGTSYVDGPDHSGLQPAAPVAALMAGNGRDVETQASDFVAVEEQPEFPGGAAAWRNFLSRYLSVPASLQGGEKKTVMVNFKVDTDGTVNGFVIVQSAGRDFDNEVIRVLKKMPKWKPAMQNGRAVAVPFTQPVTFVGVEQ